VRQADRIRAFAIDRYIAPARLGGQSRIVIRAGDVHRDLGLANAMPAVCSAIGSKLFCTEAGVMLLSRQGPANGANVYFEFALGEGDFSARQASS
jgi:5-methylcytosine-specific restriction enzyme B